jgi:hypothetical protein
MDLEPWQQEQLLLAAASSKKKMQVRQYHCSCLLAQGLHYADAQRNAVCLVQDRYLLKAHSVLAETVACGMMCSICCFVSHHECADTSSSSSRNAAGLLLLQVQTVAANTGLDRTEVLAWVAAFRAKPKAEQAKLLAPLQQQIQQLKAQQQAQSNAAQAAEAARRGREPEDTLEQQPQQQREWQEQEQLQPRSSPATQGLPFSGKNPDTGFVPYTERRGQAGSKKRLPGEVLRTLEGVYARSPWPNKEVVAGLYDLHRLPRWVRVLFACMCGCACVGHVSDLC